MELPAESATGNLETSSHANTVAENISGPPSVAEPNAPTIDQQADFLAATQPIIEANTTEPTPSTPEAIAAAPASALAEPPAEPSALVEEAASPAATEEPGIATPFSPANVLPPPPRAITLPPPLAPMPAPITPSPKAIKIVLKHVVRNPALAALQANNKLVVSSWPAFEPAETNLPSSTTAGA